MNKSTAFRLIFGALAIPLVFVTTTYSAPGDLYVSAGPSIYRLSSAGEKSTFASGLTGQNAMAFNRAGDLFVINNQESGTILRFDADGNRSTFVSGLGVLTALAFDGTGILFVAESYGDFGSIFKFTAAADKSTFAESKSLLSLAFNTRGYLFATFGGPTDLSGGIERYAPDGTQRSVSFGGNPGSIAFDSGGNMFVTTGDKVVRTSRLGEDTVVASGLVTPVGIAFDADGNLFVACSNPGKIVKVAPDGTKTTFAAGLNHPSFLAFEPVTEKLRNLSARGFIAGGDNILIGGFIVGGNALANNAVIVRALGPSLAGSGVANALPNPVLELHDGSGALIASNNDWEESQKAQITATGLAPSDAVESAVFAALPAGNYTAVVRSATDATGNALVEIYSITH